MVPSIFFLAINLTLTNLCAFSCNFIPLLYSQLVSVLEFQKFRESTATRVFQRCKGKECRNPITRNMACRSSWMVCFSKTTAAKAK
jgi:hypothetical protein